MKRKSIFLQDKDEQPFDERAYADMVGTYLSNHLETADKKFMKGEVYIFVGTRDKSGKRGITSISGTAADSSFKELLCETTMDILLEDSGIHIPKPEDENK
jgi:hypothetical protein